MLRETAEEKESEVHRRQNVNCGPKFSMDVCSAAYIRASNTAGEFRYAGTLRLTFIHFFFRGGSRARYRGTAKWPKLVAKGNAELTNPEKQNVLLFPLQRKILGIIRN